MKNNNFLCKHIITTQQDNKPLSMAPLRLYVDTLQQKHKEYFRVAESKASKNSGYGIWFNGKCNKGERLLGYSGNVILRSEAEGQFAATCGNTKWVICASSVRQINAIEGFENIPLGHMLNHANTKNKQKNNCAFQYDTKQRLLYIISKRDLDTQNEWVELYVTYNNKKI